jgi:hypothetical protein
MLNPIVHIILNPFGIALGLYSAASVIQELKDYEHQKEECRRHQERHSPRGQVDWGRKKDDQEPDY